MVIRVWALSIIVGLLVSPLLVLSLDGLASTGGDDMNNNATSISNVTSTDDDAEEAFQRLAGGGFLSKEISNMFQPRQILRNESTVAPFPGGGGGQEGNLMDTGDEEDDAEQSDDEKPIMGMPIDLPDFTDVGETIPLNCGFTWNVTVEGCARRIARFGLEEGEACDCYSFCGDAPRGCHVAGEPVMTFDCFVEDLVMGCQDNVRDAPIPVAKVGIDEPCPTGYLCSLYGQTNCEDVRQIPHVLGLGDIHAGMYCPGSDNRKDIGYRNCDVGFYCPNSTTRIPCPQGFFCPHKTAQPEIRCRSCPEGATTLERYSYTYTIVVLALASMLVVILWKAFDQYTQRRYRQLHDLQQRHADGLQDLVYKRKHLRKLRALKPRLRAIERRLREQYAHRVEDAQDLVLSTETVDGKITFDAARLFDAMDTQLDEELPYSKLNRILKLSPVQLREFTKRMNDIAGEPPDTEEVERHVFITQFLRVFGAISHLEPSPEEAAHIYDETAKQGTTNEGEVPHRLFYNSQMQDFFNDEQINALLKGFRRTQELKTEEFEEPINSKPQCAVVKYAPLLFRRSLFGLPESSFAISRDEFISHYSTLLSQVTRTQGISRVKSGMLFTSQLSLHRGLDISFQDLSVSVEVKDRPVEVLSGITGRLCDGSMTAILGGHRSGKTTLLDALSARMFYGEVTGSIQVNGNDSPLAKHRSFIGYVPKVDALYADLTVREHLVFSGKFQLPHQTPLEEIEDLADATMASLNLCRVMHRDIGHEDQNGLSALARKSVSIALELMKRPRILFLESPTDGLEPNDALRIVRDLKKFVDAGGITICATLNQPRRDAFELFDSLFLLGVSGKLVYHGPVGKVGKYFNQINYILPDGESVTDWILDIASGKLPPPVRQQKFIMPAPSRSASESKSDETTDGAPTDRPRTRKVAFAMMERRRSSALNKDQPGDSSTRPFDNVEEQAKATCELLHENWQKHMKALSSKKRAKYDPPPSFGLPRDKGKPPSIDQLFFHLRRLLILAERNWIHGFIDTFIIIVTVVLVSVMDGVAQPTREVVMRDLNYESMAQPTSLDQLLLEFPKLFSYATSGIKGNIELYATKVGVFFAVVVSVLSTKLLRANREQFFRDAGSGYSVGAYFLALNVLATLGGVVQAVLSAMFAYSYRNSLSAWYSYLVHFVMLGWVASSWGMVISLLIPRNHVIFATGFIVTFFALLFCGAIPPISFQVIYESTVATVASGLLSSMRFFVESLAVAEARCLPVQSGFTDFSGIMGEVHVSRTFERVALKYEVSSFQILHYGLNDFYKVTQRSYHGWYFGALPALFVGLFLRWLALGTLYGTNRSDQAKRSLYFTINNDTSTFLLFLMYMVVLGGLLAVSLYYILRKGEDIFWRTM